MMKIEITPRRWLLIVIGVLFVGYILFQARFLILGPQVWIDTPKDGQVVHDPLVVVSGRSSNIAWMSLDDRQIYTDEKGLWSEKLIVGQGLSIMTMNVRDRFGRQASKSVRIILN